MNNELPSAAKIHQISETMKMKRRESLRIKENHALKMFIEGE